jgi:septal ring factor EnvC (AmiA/AmiB activator)
MARLEDLADGLYALRPDEFTAARNALAKETKPDDAELAAEVQALKKPSPAAWVINVLTRHRRDALVELVQLGATMREAQADLDRASIAELSKQRRQVVAAMARDAADLAQELGQKVTQPVVDEVAQTLQAALSDELAAGAVLSGRLLRGLETVGTEVDVTDAVAAPGDLAIPKAPPRPKSNVVDLASHRELAEARKAVEEAEHSAEEAEGAVEDIDSAIADVVARRDELADELSRLEEKVADLEGHIRTLERERRSLDRDRDKADRLLEQEKRVVERARERLSGLSN